ncbi:hypothetical protein [Microcoleus sp. Pol17_C1]|uniref:hypothetical protein n=1 Tax=unclassified Microcoleus TaxID=2642155 RepID=UPI002FD42951
MKQPCPKAGNFRLKNKAKNTADGVPLALAQDGEHWVNYLDKYCESVQLLMNLTCNKHRFYQEGIQAATPLFGIVSRPISLASRPLKTQKNERKLDILVVKKGFHHHLPLPPS